MMRLPSRYPVVADALDVTTVAGLSIAEYCSTRTDVRDMIHIAAHPCLDPVVSRSHPIVFAANFAAKQVDMWR